jgi:ribosomal-protein-alanine N-acetyltransferase
MRGADLDVVMGIEQDSFSTPWSRASFLNLLGRGDAQLWVAVVNQAVVAYSVVWYVASEAELGNLAVSPDWRRHGLGAWLLDWSIENARQRGVERMFLEVRVSNLAAQGLYERRGFVQVGLRRRYYRAPAEDARVMCLDLRRKQ